MLEDMGMGFDDWLVLLLPVLSQASNITWGHSMDGSMVVFTHVDNWLVVFFVSAS